MKRENKSLSEKAFIVVVLLLLVYASILISYKAVGILKDNSSLIKITLMSHKFLKVPDSNLLPLYADKSKSSIYKNLIKPLNVFFFVSSNCPYCIKEISDFESYKNDIIREFPNVRFIICFLDDKASVRNFLKRTGLSFPNVYVLQDAESLRKLAIKYTPTTFVINNK